MFYFDYELCPIWVNFDQAMNFGHHITYLMKRHLCVPGQYRVTQQVSDLGWFDFEFGCSTVCPILLGLIRDRLDMQRSLAR